MNTLAMIVKPRYVQAPPPPVTITVLNNAFTDPTVANGGQTTISTTSQVASWLFNSVSGINVRILNNLSTSDNASPPNWNTVPVKTVLYVCQYGIATTNVTQSVTFPSTQAYTVSVWVNHRKTYYNSAQKFSILVDGQEVVSPVSFASGATSTNWAKYSGTYTPSTTGSKVVTLRWDCTQASVDTTIMVTQIEIISV